MGSLDAFPLPFVPDEARRRLAFGARRVRQSAEPERSRGCRTRAKEPLNVILLTVDSLRIDVPWLGYARAIAPNLTKLAAESVVYERAYAASSYTARTYRRFRPSGAY